MAISVVGFFHMLWCDFQSKLKELNPLLWINTADDGTPHSEYPELRTFGIYYDKHHVAGVVYDDVPERDIYDEKGIMTHQGIRTIAKGILEGKKYYAQTKNEFLKRGKSFDLVRYYIEPSDIRRVFGIDI